VFEIIERNDNWTKQELNSAETKWIESLLSRDRCMGYNITKGGEGVDSQTARKYALDYYKNQTTEQKKIRSKGCSLGQTQRYKNAGDTYETKERKRISHRGEYLIESPAGRQWQTKLGLQQFAEDFADEIGISYWSLFNAYRKCYKNTPNKKKYKNENHWKVTRIDV